MIRFTSNTYQMKWGILTFINIPQIVNIEKTATWEQKNLISKCIIVMYLTKLINYEGQKSEYLKGRTRKIFFLFKISSM